MCKKWNKHQIKHSFYFYLCQINANGDAYGASVTALNIVYARFLKITVQNGNAACIRVQLCGHGRSFILFLFWLHFFYSQWVISGQFLNKYFCKFYFIVLLPDAVKQLNVSRKTAITADISWTFPEYEGHGGITYFLISLNDSNQSTNVTRQSGNNQHQLKNLKSYTNYKVTVQAGNAYGLGSITSETFGTDEAGTVLS